MKPTRKTTWRGFEYWACDRDHVHHKNEAGARECIKKYAPPGFPSSLSRNIKITKAILNGKTYKEAGEQCGISAVRASQIMEKMLRVISIRETPAKRTALPDTTKISEIRKQKDFWLKRIRAFATSSGVDQEPDDER